LADRPILAKNRNFAAMSWSVQSGCGLANNQCPTKPLHTRSRRFSMTRPAEIQGQMAGA